MDIEGYKNFLLHNLPKAKIVSGGKEINCRCQYCSDSKNLSKGHFYISIPQNDNELSFFNCVKCHTHGIVSHNTLILWGVYDSNVAGDLASHNKIVLNNPANRIYNSSFVYKMFHRQITDDKLSRYKLKYVNDRIGTSLTFDDCANEKIVLNLYDLLNENRITNYTRNPNIVDLLDSSFVGFLSVDNAFVNMRNLEIKDLPETIDKRYINYNVVGKYDNTQRFYTIPTKLDLYNPNPIKLHIAEGPFDILSIYHNLRKGDIENSIFTSIGGSGYLGILKYFIIQQRLVNLEVHYYPDKDIDDYVIEDIYKLLKTFNIRIFIHRNMYTGEKDFGVPMNKISESVRQIQEWY